MEGHQPAPTAVVYIVMEHIRDVTTTLLTKDILLYLLFHPVLVYLGINEI